MFHLHSTSATRELSVYLDGQRLWHECHPTHLGVTLDHTLSYREHLTKTSRYHLGRQSQHSAVICSGALLFSSRVLCPSLVTLCSHKSGRCAAELCHASHLWHPPFQCSPTLNRQPYEGRLPLTSWWRKSSNMTVGQSSLISLAPHCYD